MKFIPYTLEWIGAMCDLWNKELGKHFPMREQLFRQNSFDDENIFESGSWLVVQDEKLVGFIITKKWQEERVMRLGKDSGWIHALVVREDVRQQGIGGQLLVQAEEALKIADCKHVFAGRDPWHYFPGVPHELPDARTWFEHRGFEAVGAAYDLYAEVKEGAYPYPQYQEGAEARLLTMKDQAEMLRFFARCFPDRWYYEAQCYWERGGQGREFIGLFAGDEMIGFCRVNDDQSPMIAQNTYWAPLFLEPMGGIGPLGIDERYRGKGYGLAIVQHGAAELAARGMKHLVIDWTGLVDFYAKIGFKPWKGYEMMSKTLT